MSNEVSIDLNTTSKIEVEGTSYSITFELTNPVGIQRELFVVKRVDSLSAEVEFLRVASLEDIHTLKTSGLTEDLYYLVDKTTIPTNSLSFIGDLKDGIPLALQVTLNQVSEGLLELIDLNETVTITGENE